MVEDDLAESLSYLAKDIQLIRPVTYSPVERLLRRLYRMVKR